MVTFQSNSQALLLKTKHRYLYLFGNDSVSFFHPVTKSKNKLGQTVSNLFPNHRARLLIKVGQIEAHLMKDLKDLNF